MERPIIFLPLGRNNFSSAVADFFTRILNMHKRQSFRKSTSPSVPTAKKSTNSSSRSSSPPANRRAQSQSAVSTGVDYNEVKIVGGGGRKDR
jgi:hypothetical protein